MSSIGLGKLNYLLVLSPHFWWKVGLTLSFNFDFPCQIKIESHLSFESDVMHAGSDFSPSSFSHFSQLFELWYTSDSFSLWKYLYNLTNEATLLCCDNNEEVLSFFTFCLVALNNHTDSKKGELGGIHCTRIRSMEMAVCCV